MASLPIKEEGGRRSPKARDTLQQEAEQQQGLDEQRRGDRLVGQNLALTGVRSTARENMVTIEPGDAVRKLLEKIQQGVSTGTTNIIKYEKRPGSTTTKGQQFEYGMVSLLFLRSLRGADSFLLGSNLAALGVFDDIFLKITLTDEKGIKRSEIACVQLKYKEAKGYTVSQGSLTSPKGDFSILNFFDSYLTIERLFEDSKQASNNELVRGCTLEDCVFVLFTNCRVGHKSPNMNKDELRTVDTFLSTGSNNEDIFSFDSRDNDIWSLRDNNEKYHTFLRHFRIFSGQCQPKALNQLITDEVMHCTQVQGNVAKELCFRFVKEIEIWWNDYNIFLNDCSPQWNMVLLEGINAQMVGPLLKLQCAFENEKCGFLDGQMRKDAFLNILIPNIDQDIRCLKLFIELEIKFKDRYLLINSNDFVVRKEQILSLCTRGFCDVLVININESSDINHFSCVLRQDMFKVVLVSETKLCVAEKPGDVLTDKWRLDDFTQECQKRILCQMIEFQGEKVRINQLCEPRTLKDLGGRALSNFIKCHVVIVGQPLEKPADTYIPRTLRHQTVLKKEILEGKHDNDIFAISGFPQDGKKSSSLSEDKMNVYGLVKSKESTVILSYFTEHISECTNSDEEHPDKQKYLDLCRQHTDTKNIHWLIYDSEFLIWKDSHGSKITPSLYIDHMSDTCENEASCCHVAGYTPGWNERLLLITGEPGIGKSTLLNHVAREAKHSNPTWWVVHVVLSNFTRILHENSADKLTREIIVDILLEAACESKSTCSSLAKKLMQNSIDVNGDIIVLLDAVDEVTPTYKTQVVKIAQLLLQETKVTQVWVTSRSAHQEYLQKELSSLPLTLEPFTEEEQRTFFNKYFDEQIMSGDVDKKHLYEQTMKLLDLIKTKGASSMGRQISDVPLHTWMIAESIIDWAKAADSSDIKVLPQLNLHRMYDFFFSKKRDLYYERYKIEKTRTIVTGNTEREDQLFLEDHTKCALLVMFSPEERKRLNIVNWKEEDMSFLERIKLEKTGIIYDVIDGNPKFVHFSFSEYLVAKWFMDCFKEKQSVDSRKTRNENVLGFFKYQALSSGMQMTFFTLLEDRFELVRFFFDQMLSEGFELHESVLAGNTDLVRQKVQSGASVYQVDGGGRLALHLAAAHGHSEAARILLAAGSPVAGPDTVLGWNPLRYADRVEAWDVAEQLLKRGASDSDMPLLRSKVKGKVAGNILISASKAGQLHLIDLLLRMGININEKDINGYTALAMASIFGRKDLVQLLLNKKAKIQCTTTLGDTPLHLAAQEGHLEIVKLLLKSEADLNLENKNGSTALTLAAWRGHNAVVTLLLANKAIINKPDNDNDTPLHYAALEGHLETVRLLLARGADVHLKNSNWETALMLAALRGHKAVAALLIENKANVNCKTVHGTTPLHCAALEGHLGTVKVLLASGAKLNVHRDGGSTALMLAAERGHTSVVALLIENKADIKYTLHIAVQEGHLETAQLLLDKGSDVNLKDGRGRNALAIAALSGHTALLALLIEKNGDINCTDSRGDSALHLAARAGYLETVNLLLTTEAGKRLVNSSEGTTLTPVAEKCPNEVTDILIENKAFINCRNNSGDTPLHYATQEGHLETVQLLLTRGADLHLADNVGNTALALAALYAHEAVASLLLKNKAIIDCTNTNGNTPLHYAVRQAHLKIIQLLLDSGAKLNLENNEGYTPLTLAANMGHNAVVNILIENKVDIASTDSLGRTPLHAAAMGGRLDIMQLLLARGSDAQLVDSNGDTALSLAAYNGRSDAVSLLFENKVAINCTNIHGMTALHYAAQEGKMTTVELLLARGADVHLADHYGNTALSLATMLGRKRVVEYLQHYRNTYGGTPRQKNSCSVT